MSESLGGSVCFQACVVSIKRIKHVPLTSTTAPADDAQLYTYHAHHFIFSFTYYPPFASIAKGEVFVLLYVFTRHSLV